MQPFGLTEATWLPLLRLSRARAPMRQKELAASLSLDGSSVVRLIDSLETAGFVGRNVDPQDRRVVRVALTDQGREKVKGLREDRTAYLRRRLAELQPRDRATLRAALPLLSVLADEAAR